MPATYYCTVMLQIQNDCNREDSLRYINMFIYLKSKEYKNIQRSLDAVLKFIFLSHEINLLALVYFLQLLKNPAFNSHNWHKK